MPPVNESRVIERLTQAGHHYAVQWLEGLSGAARQRLLGELAQLDLARVNELAALIGAPRSPLDFNRILPAPVAQLPVTEQDSRREEAIARIGRQALAEDRVVALTAAGGQGTRFNYPRPKGTFPITPVLGKCFFHVHAERILAARRRYGTRMPWLIMTNPENDAATRSSFQNHNFFGLGQETVHFFAQRMNPVLDARGRLLRAKPSRLLLGPDGSAGIYEALNDAGLLDWLKEGGWDLISYFQVDNPLVRIADERFVAHHLETGAEFSCKAVRRRDPAEGVGLCVLKDGRPTVVEYIDVPDNVARQRDESGHLRFLYGSIAIHIINVEFARRMVGQGLPLPWHVTRKRYETVNDDGEAAPAEGGGHYKFERFVFEALPHATACAFVEVERDGEFAPVKRQEGQDTPGTSREIMQQLWADWLERAGVRVRDETGKLLCPIEISPLYAETAGELAERLRRDGPPVGAPIVLE